MTTYYVDQEGGNDANAGTSFALRKKTIAAVTAAMLAAGDEVRVMASPDPTLVGDATWTNDSRTITLAAECTKRISDGESLWTAAANVTATRSTTRKQGTYSASIAIAAGHTTGLAAHHDLTVPAPAITASASVANYGAASNAVDGNNNTFWGCPLVAGTSYWQADFGEALEVTHYSFRARNDAWYYQSPTQWDVLGSNDGSSWTTIETDTTSAAWTTGSVQTFAFASPQTYRYLRFVIDSVQLTTDLTIAEVAFTFSTLAALDFSAYQQVSFWFQSNVVLADATKLSLRLCSDTAGAVTVDTIPLPAYPGANIWQVVTYDKGSALGASIQSIALYADTDIGAVTVLLDNIIACKAPSAADSLNLQSLIGKAHKLPWQASTAYTLGQKRQPSAANRNGFVYEVTTAGTSDAAEPTWPQGWGKTVTDGTVVWECVDIEEAWYPIQSIAGTTVMLDGHPTIDASWIYGKYQGDTETVATYKREPIENPTIVSASFQAATTQLAQDSGTVGVPIVYSGGWSRTDMASITGETWIDSRNGNGQAFHTNSKAHLTVRNFGGARGNAGLYIVTNPITSKVTLENLHAAGCVNGVYWDGSGAAVARNLVAVNCPSRCVDLSQPRADVIAVRGEGAGSNFPQTGVYVGNYSTGNPTRWRYVVSRGNVTGVATGSDATVDIVVSHLRTARNSAGASVSTIARGGTVLDDWTSTADATRLAALSASYLMATVATPRYDGVANDHRITFYGGTILTDTAQRHTASGVSWKFNPTNATYRTEVAPLVLPLAKIALTAGSPKSVTIWTRRDNTNIKGRLVAYGGQVDGILEDVSVACEPAINTWVESSTLTLQSEVDGVVEVVFEVWDATGTTNSFWIDDLTVV